MPEQARIWVRPLVESPVMPFEDVINTLDIEETEKERLRTGTIYEKQRRVEYHRSRYLCHLTDDELHQRIGYMIANVTYVSNHHRYSTNNLYAHYWRDKIAHAAEELAIRNCARPVSSEVLNHLPRLGFAAPAQAALQHDPNRPAFFRYGELRHIRSLRETGDVFLRCASTKNEVSDAARNDDNELCVSLRMLKEHIDVHSFSI